MALAASTGALSPVGAMERSPIPRQCLEHLPLPALVFEHSLRTNFINLAARRFFGLQLDDQPEASLTGAESFFGPGVRLDRPPEAHALTDFGAQSRTLTCFRIPPLANSAALPTAVRCCIATFVPEQGHFKEQANLLASGGPASLEPLLPSEQEPWFIVTILEVVAEPDALAAGAAPSAGAFPLFAQNIQARPLPELGHPGSAKATGGPAADEAADSFFPPVAELASKPSLVQRTSSASAAPSVKSTVTTSSGHSQTPSSIFSAGSVSTSASSQPPHLPEEPVPLSPKAPRAAGDESPASRIISQHRASELQRRRQPTSPLSQSNVPTPESVLGPLSPTYGRRPPLQRARASTGSSTSSLKQHSFSYSSSSSATARNPMSDSGSEQPIANQDGLPAAVGLLARVLLATLPQSGLVLVDKDCEHGLVNDTAFDLLTGQKKRQRAGELKDGSQDETLAWSEDGFFTRKRGTPANNTPQDVGAEPAAPTLSPPADSPGLTKMILSGILNIFLPPSTSEEEQEEADGPSTASSSTLGIASLIKAKKPYRVFDAAFSTRIIDPLESLLDLVARRGDSPATLVGSGELRVGIEVDVEEEDGEAAGKAYTTIIEHPPPGFSSVQSNVLRRKRVCRRVVHVTAGPLHRNDGTHIGGVLVLKDITDSSSNPSPDAGTLRNTVGEGHFQQILEHLPHLIWTTTPSGSHDYFNEQWYHYTGLEPETSLGLGWQNPFHPDDMPRTLAAWSRSLATGEPYSVEYRCRRHDGAFRWMLGRANCLRDTSGQIIGWFGSCTDIEEAVNTRQELKRMQKDLEAVLNGADLALINFDRDLRLKSIRGGMGESLMRRYPQVMEGLPAQGNLYQDLVAPGAWERFDLETKTSLILSGKEDNIVFEYEREDVKYKASMAPQIETRADGRTSIVGVIIVLVDVTGLKLAERALQDVQEDYARSLIEEAAAKEASQMKTEFLSTVNHELRTPISAIMGLSELLLDDGSIQATSRDYVQKIVRSSEALLQMIGSILDISKAEAGKLELNPRPFALKEVLEEARIFEVVANQKGLAYSQDLSGNVAYDLVVNGDFGRIRQILNNLLSNAIKFTKKGSVSLNVHYEDLGDRVEARFTVVDTGMGIKAETLPTLFQAYEQAPGTSARYGGTGLGLYISKKLAEMMSGDVAFQSVFGQGTTAVLTLPLAKSLSPPSSLSPSTPESENVQFDRSKTKVLVAEDNPVNREVAVRFLQKAGYTVSSVENGQEALQAVEREHFQLLVMDCGMPQMDGYETARHIRLSDSPHVRNLRLLALTASAGANDRERCLQAGFNDYLTKPFKGKMLERIVLDLLNNEAPSSPPSGRSSKRGSVS